MTTVLFVEAQMNNYKAGTQLSNFDCRILELSF